MGLWLGPFPSSEAPGGRSWDPDGPFWAPPGPRAILREAPGELRGGYFGSLLPPKGKAAKPLAAN